MNTLLVIFGLTVALITALGMLAAETRKGKQIEKLKKAIREQEELAAAADLERLVDADIVDIVGFLNRVPKNDPGPN